MELSAVVKAVLAVSLALSLAVEAQLTDHKSFHRIADRVEWASSVGTFYDDERRLLHGRGAPIHYYISYGALSANRVPCPPRSGRSYYTNNCFKSREPVNPYARGCSCITHCRR